jgi:metallophosphoesterase (TIGR00282 family)
MIGASNAPIRSRTCCTPGGNNRVSRASSVYSQFMSLRILVLGDIVGRPGRQVVHQKLPALVRDKQVDLVIANAENIAGGSGITTNLFHKIRSYGIDVVTLGDHIYKRIDIVPTLQASERIVRPANLSAGAAGRPFTVVTTNSGVSVAVFSVLGRIYMNLPSDDPFAAADRVLAQIPRDVRVCVCDCHAEATSEKVAMGHWLDGRVSLIFGTHTHIPTADAKILAGGSAYITDVGMCGPYDSVLGRRKDRVVKHMTTNMPQPFDVATGDVRLCGALATIDAETGRALEVERVEVQGDNADQAYDADDARTPQGGGD